ncbi:spore maturation protein CgeB [Paenibacillus shirakamiensis]|uniref:Spore maturation protein CgeB n=1 Tax=Paenibacillus shirakamiensis TaxID=1265935 RepID=A0ABS4JK98_9BACL|nr:spore maturation protein CgeB [Paenibacillus shirakamiensis]
MRNLLDEGRLDGYAPGFREGYRFGGCQAVLDDIPVEPLGRHHWRVLYIPQGFDAIDRSIMDALEQIAAECKVASAAEMVAEAATYQPDLVLVMNALHVFPADHAEHIQLVRQMGIRTAVWFVDDPYFTDDTALLCRHYDDVFTHEISAVSFYKEMGCPRVHYLPLAASSTLYSPQKTAPKYHFDVAFIGNAFWNRVALFDEMATFLKHKKVLIAGGFWERLTQKENLNPFVRSGWIPPEETARYYNGSRIVINIHRPTTVGMDNHNSRDLPGHSINPRTYEINACGTLQMTDIREGLKTYYRPGYDIETFNDAQDLMSKIEYYLAHEEERLQVAWRSLCTTRKYHTYPDRIRRLLDTSSSY